MTHYNFYSTYVETIFDGDVLFDSRKCSIRRICAELIYDLRVSKYYHCNAKKQRFLDSLVSIIETLSDSSFTDSSVFSFLSRLLFVAGRRYYGHCHIHFNY